MSHDAAKQRRAVNFSSNLEHERVFERGSKPSDHVSASSESYLSKQVSEQNTLQYKNALQEKLFQQQQASLRSQLGISASEFQANQTKGNTSSEPRAFASKIVERPPSQKSQSRIDYDLDVHAVSCRFIE